MLSYDIRSLASRAVQVDGTLAADDPVWRDDDVRPSRPVHVVGRLSAAGPGRYYFSGHLDGEAADECRRCLTDVSVAVSEDVQLLFVEEGTEGDDDPDVFVVDGRAYDLDLRPALREQWVLAVPAFVQCRDDCKGLCPTCGADLNAGACDCAPTTDSRWDALRKVRGQST
ncbi:MAG TPA: DUF177 domain-containing protein [Gemmatimonadaceae bacterium]|jgi:uncharacterized protein|nr:DUF177 domain-containing protein [Gemmatimonadaceae bacterium]